jgi:hypothetical protein
MKKTVVIVAAILALGLVGGAIAYASIPGPDGVIHGCYKTSTGMLIAIDSAASCPSGYTALNWNQTGPQGPAGTNGVSGYEVVQQRVSFPYNSGQQQTFQLDCPTGKAPLSGADKPVNVGSGFDGPAWDYPNGSGWSFAINPISDNLATNANDLYVVCAVMA